MRYLLEPAVRLINRLPYAQKFFLIGLLIVIQAAVLIFMLVSELNKNIDSIAEERLGVTYCQTLVTLLDEAQVYRNLQYAYSLGNHSLRSELLAQQGRVDASLAAVDKADKQLGGPSWDTHWKLEVLHREWDTRKQDALQFEPARAQVAFILHSRWIGDIIDFIQQVGNSSNLAVDNDLDTSDLIDSVLHKLPVLMDNISQARAFGRTVPEGNILAADDKERLLYVAGIVRSTQDQLNRNMQTVMRHNKVVKGQLDDLNDPANDPVTIFIWNFEQKVVGPQGQPIPQQLLESDGDQAIKRVASLYGRELAAIGQLLDLRMSHYTRDRNMVTGFTVGVLFLVCCLFLAFDMSVRKGIYQLNTLMDLAAKGNLGARGDIYSRDELGSLTSSINSMLDSLEMMYEEVRQSHDRLEIWNQELEQKVAERTASLRNLLDHAGQGFLSFGDDLRVAGEYSAECVTIFGRDIIGEAVTTLFYPEDKDQRTFLEALFHKLFEEEKELLRDTYFSLLPEELVLDERFIGVVYKFINRPGVFARREIMLILTDQTNHKVMEERVEEEKNILAMVVRVVTHAGDFFASVRQYAAFCQDDFPGVAEIESLSGDKLDVIFRIVHTYKGTFGQLGMRNMVQELHDLEELLASIRATGVTSLNRNELTERFDAYTPEKMLNWLDKDMTILKDILGESFFLQGDTLVVDGARLLDIEEKIQNILTPAECRLLLPDLRRLRYKPFKELLNTYPEYVLTLAEKYERLIDPFVIDGGETPVDPLKYYEFAKALGHVFRNAIAHGVETPDERLEAGKEEYGVLTCTIREQANGLIVVITDDGRGIDPARIREIAVKKGISDRNAAMALSAEEAIQLIFTDGFSGTEEVSQLSGRGVGLSAVRAETEKLGGSVQVYTTPGHGTEFHFFLPQFDRKESEPDTLTQMAKPLLAATKRCLTRLVDLKMKEWVYCESVPSGKLPLLKVTTFVDVKGKLCGKMALSADESVVKLLVSTRQVGQDKDFQADKWLETILSQFAGEIFSDALAQAKPDEAEAIKAEALVTILAEDASAKYPQAEISTWMLETQAGWLKLSLIY